MQGCRQIMHRVRTALRRANSIVVRACLLATSAKLLKQSYLRQLGIERKWYPAIHERKKKKTLYIHNYRTSRSSKIMTLLIFIYR